MARGRKKETGEIKEAKSAFKSAQALYGQKLKSYKSVFKAFFGKAGVKAAEKYAKEEVTDIDFVEFSEKTGKPVMGVSRQNTSFLQKATNAIKTWAESEELPTVEHKDVGFEHYTDFANKLATAPAVAIVNRRLDAIRKMYGEDSAYMARLKRELEDKGLVFTKQRIRDEKLTGGMRLSATKSALNSMSLEKLWSALSDVKSIDAVLTEAITDVESSLTKDEVKEQVAIIKKDPTKMKAYVSVYMAQVENKERFSELLKEFYSAKPGDATSKAYEEYLEIERLYKKKGRKTWPEIEDIIKKMNAFYRKQSGLPEEV